MRQQSHNKCVEVTPWLKKHLYFDGVFDFFGGIQILPFCRRSEIHGRKVTPVLI